MSHDLPIAFSLRGLDGLISVTVRANADPVSVGYGLLWPGEPPGAARGYPVCRATVAYPAQGYAAVFGWTQLVSSTDSASGAFEMDPIAIYAQVPTPFAWFGVRPELFDAPSRESRDDLDWQAHSFLCISPDAVITRRVRAVAGFSWGFTISDQAITLAAPQVLGAQAWDSHLGLLRQQYPQWAFDAGYASS